jgi:hypothetical protein
MQDFRLVFILAILSATPVACAEVQGGSDAGSELILAIRPYERTLVEKAPFVFRVTLENPGEKAHSVYFARGTDMRSFDLFTLHAIDDKGVEHRLKPLRVLTSPTIRAPGAALPPSARLETDHVMCLYSPPTVGGEEAPGGGYFLGPGRYSVYGTLRCPPVVRSEAFAITVIRAERADAAALRIFEALPLYAQGTCREPGAGMAWACGGEVKEVIEKLARVQAHCSESAFATWIVYWGVFYGLETRDPARVESAVDGACAFAEAHPEFPLTDNLLFRTARSLFALGEAARAGDLVLKLRARYPKSDCDPEALATLEEEIREANARGTEAGDEDSNGSPGP